MCTNHVDRNACVQVGGCVYSYNYIELEIYIITYVAKKLFLDVV